MFHSIFRTPPRRGTSRRRYFVLGAALLVVLLTVPGLRHATADENRYDIMRLITTQWIKPFMYISLDTSGSMHMTFDQSYNSDQSWYFDFGYVDGTDIDGYINLEDDYTHNTRGIGQGFWMRAAVLRELAEPPTEWQYDGYEWSTGWVDHDYPDNIYSPGSEPAMSRGQLIQIVDYPIEGVNGVYLVSADSANSGHNSGWRYTKFYKMSIDGSFDNSNYVFPLDNGSDVTPFTFRRVTLDTDPLTLHHSGDSDNARMNDGARSYLYIDEDLDVTAGDIVEVTGFSDSANNGTFFIRRYVDNTSGYDRFTVSKMDALGNFPDSEHSFLGPDDYGGFAEFMWLDYDPQTLWYFISATRIAIAKNVWGADITVYEPSIDPSGYDNDNKAYYLFDGVGPTNGAYMTWEGSGDNGNGGGTWYNYSPGTANAPPAGDPAYTKTQAPSEMVGRFADVAHIGLIEYSGSCPSGNFGTRVTLDPVTPTSVVSAIEARFDTRSGGGIQPGGSTPTKKAISSAGVHLVTAYNNDPQNTCGRTYGVLLMTDGISNQCNPGDGSWDDCTDDWDLYPAGDSNDLWFESAGGVDLEIRTWVLGVSEEVGRCELNFTAYKGRTDASSPNGDAGFSISEDPYLTEDNSDVYDTTHGDYAYFANSVDELRQALLDIISAMGVGDYATAAPAVASSGGATAGNVGFLGSSEYPSWEGHLRAFDLTLGPADAGYELWDAADELADTVNPNNNFSRRIYTWDPANSNAIVQIAPGTEATLDTICSGCGVTDSVVDFILGNDGDIPPASTVGTMRPSQLGAVINSTPAVIGPPVVYNQNQLQSHSTFETDYGLRHTLVWIGTSDGSVSAFDLADGTEILRLIPPNMLDKQVDLYNNYFANPAKSPLGQSGLPADHIFGVANSLRFSDVWDSAISEYRSVMFITEGPGGSGVHAIDVTHPYPGRTIGSDVYPADSNYGYGILGDPPFQVLWSKTGDGEAGTTQLAGLGDETWAVPALGASAADEWVLQVGAGYEENATNSITPKVFYFDPVTGDPFIGDLAASTATLSNSGTYYVPNNSFADSVVWQEDSNIYKSDNLVSESVQADLNGHLWSITEGISNVQRSALVTLSDGDPLYYSPAVAGYPYYPVEYALYAFSTGSFYSESSAINGPNVGTSGNFIPRIYIAAKTLSSGSVASQGVALTLLPDPDATVGNTLGDKTQVIAPPLIFTPDEDNPLDPFALYLVYDPDGATCVGVSYIVRVNFDPSNLSAIASDIAGSISVYEAGEGMAGGFALAGEKVVVSQSGVGEGEEARLVEVPNLNIPVGGPSDDVTWWIELQ